jgi:hypothetical protein
MIILAHSGHNATLLVPSKLLKKIQITIPPLIGPKAFLLTPRHKLMKIYHNIKLLVHLITTPQTNVSHQFQPFHWPKGFFFTPKHMFLV